MAEIKKILVGGTTYDIHAYKLLDNAETGHTYEEIVALINKGLQLVIDSKHSSKDEPATAASASTMGKLYLVQLTNQTKSGTYTEFITLESGTGTKTYSWEKIGTTAADLTDYAKKGSYTSGGPSTNVTGSAGEQTASGSATITYKKSDAATGAAGGVTINGSNFNFSGTKATITSTGSYKPAGSVSYSGSTAATKKGVKVSTTACGDSEKGTVTISGGTASGTVAAITGIPNFSGGSLTGTKTFVTGVTGFSGGSLNPATTVTVVTGVTGASASGTTTVVTGYPNFSGGSATGTFVTGVKNAGSASIAAYTATATGRVQYVESVSGGSATGTFNTGAIKSISGTKNYGFSASTSNVMSAPTVSNGVLSWTVSNAGTQDAHTGDAAGTASVSYTAPSPVTKYLGISHSDPTFNTDSVGWTAASLGTASTVSVVTGIQGGTASSTTSVVPSYTLTAASLGTLNKGTVSLTAASLGTLSTATVVTGVTAASLGGTTTFVTSALKAASLAEDTATTPTFAFDVDGIKAITGLSFAGTTATISVSSEYTPAGSITGSQTVGNHTHSIGLTNTSVTGTAAVAVSNHTHTLSNHTHSTTI